MKTTTLLGICIMFIVAAAVAHAQISPELQTLLDTYDTSYDDGSYAVSIGNIAITNSNASIAGNIKVTFNITGPAYSNITASADVVNTDPTYGAAYRNVISSISTGSGTATMTFDGNYFGCRNQDGGTSGLNSASFTVSLRIFANSALSYQRPFTTQISCDMGTNYVTFASQTEEIKAIDANTNGKFDAVNITLSVVLKEAGTHTVGVYITDNQTHAAYQETSVSIPSQQIKTITLVYPADSIKNFKLNNNQLFLQDVLVDGHPIAIDNDRAVYNEFWPSNQFSISDFEFSDISINNYAFDTSDMTAGKINKIDVVLTAQNIVSAPYDVKLSLENDAGEFIAIQNATITSGTTTIYFNGTDIYRSRVNGPYRVGFIAITKAGAEYYYDAAQGLSQNFGYSNFTAPQVSDLAITSNSTIKDGSDINVTITNKGTADATGITVSLFDANANKIKEIILQNITAGLSYTAHIANVPSVQFAAIDFNDLIEESNETNNIALASTTGGITPPNITLSQPTATSIPMDEGQIIQFNITATGTSPSYAWYLNGTVMSTANNFAFMPTYYDEGIKTLKVNVSNSNGSVIRTWQINISPSQMALYAYAYNQTYQILNGSFQSIIANVSVDGSPYAATSDASPFTTRIGTNAVHTIDYRADGFQPLTINTFFDRKLFSCADGSNCTIATAGYNTTCSWDSPNNDNWKCMTTNGANTAYYRLYTNPKRVRLAGNMVTN